MCSFREAVTWMATRPSPYDFLQDESVVSGASAKSSATAPFRLRPTWPVCWSANAPQSMRPDVYVYTLGQLQQADLKVEVRIVAEVVNMVTDSSKAAIIASCAPTD